MLGLLSFASFVFGMVTAIAGQTPQYDPAHQRKIAHDGYIFDRNGELLAVLRGKESRVILKSDQIAPIMKQAIVAIEDKRFYDHRGVDLRAIGRALVADIENKAVVQGGSTITQQFIKNAYVKDQRSVARKLKEAALAWQLEQRKTKDWILTAYLNTIYFGNGAYGIGQAALTYFQKPASRLTLPEAALLAGIPRDPARFDPVTNPKASKERRRIVLDQMLQQGIIAPDQHSEARSAALPGPDEVRLPGTQERQGQYFVNYVKQQLISDEDYGPGAVFGGGLRVYTTLDTKLQKLARKSIAKVLTDPDGPQAALVAIDNKTGEVMAMVGGSNYRESQFNLAVQGERQPGSAFKPFVLAAALNEGISPATQFESHQTVIPLGDKLWQVNNYEGSYLGSINLETATIHSDNSVYAQLTSVVGPQNVARMAHQAGIRSKLNSYFAIGLGAEAANPLEMARAFSTFANGGQRIDGSILGNQPRAVTKIGKRENEPVGHRVLSPEKTAILNSILQKVVTQGTGRRAALGDRPVAGKTGTTENYGDAWFVGYVPQVTVAVWVGYPRELRSMETEFHGDAVAGGTFPAEIWRTFMQQALRYLKKEPESFHFDVCPVCVASRGRLPGREAAGRQRQLPHPEGGALLLGPGAEPDGELQAERGRRPGARRPAGAGCAHSARRTAADAGDRLQGRQARSAAQCRARAAPEGRPPALRVWSRDSRRGEADPRGRASAGRDAPRAGSAQVRAARPQDRGRGGVAGSSWARRLPAAPGRGRRSAGDDCQDRCRGLIGLLRNLEPFSA